jgi:hypothetical protein
MFLIPADLDADGDVDFVTSNRISPPTVSVLLNNGGGTFAPPVPYAVSSDPRSPAVADFDRDGDLDLAVPCVSPGGVSLLAGQGGGTFAPFTLHALPGVHYMATSDDFDFDVDPDLAVLDMASPYGVWILRNCVTSGMEYCAGDGSGTACPCGNSSALGGRAGCLNSLGLGATLRGNGSARLSNDQLNLAGASMPDAAVLYFQSTSAIAGGAGTAFGDGLRCAGGAVTRLGTKTNVGGQSSYPNSGDAPVSVRGAVTSPGVRFYQAWYRNAASFCTPSTFNLTNGLKLLWMP